MLIIYVHTWGKWRFNNTHEAAYFVFTLEEMIGA